LKPMLYTMILALVLSLFPGNDEQAYAYSENYLILSVRDTAKVYTRPAIRSKTITKIAAGQRYPVLRSSKYYHYISLPDGRFGWVRKRFSSVVSVPFQSGEYLTVAEARADNATVYAGPAKKYGAVTVLNEGSQFAVVEESKYYYRIQMLDGQFTWIHKTKARLLTKDRTVMGWHYLGTTDKFIAEANAAPTLNTVSPRWFRIAETAPYVTFSIDENYVAWANETGKELWPMLGNKFDPVLTDTILSDKAKSSLMAQTIAEQVIKHGLDGINVDFENMDVKNKQDYVDFIQRLKDLLAPHGKIVSVDVTRHIPDPFWSGSYDRAALGKAADYVIMMGYDEHWSGGGKAGSVASLPWAEEGIRLLLQDVPSHKVILGIPFYTKEWITDSAGKVTAKDLSMSQVNQLMASRKLTPVWDERALQHYVEFTDNGNKHQIWIENKTSMELRWNLVHEYRLAGVSAWALGMETSDIWSVFE
jgi:spore germination protein